MRDRRAQLRVGQNEIHHLVLRAEAGGAVLLAQLAVKLDGIGERLSDQ